MLRLKTERGTRLMQLGNGWARLIRDDTDEDGTERQIWLDVREDDLRELVAALDGEAGEGEE